MAWLRAMIEGREPTPMVGAWGGAAHQPRRLLSRIEAARYAGVCATTFDKMVRDGEMPTAKRCRSRKLWDIVELDSAIDDLPTDGEPNAPANDWDDDEG